MLCDHPFTNSEQITVSNEPGQATACLRGLVSFVKFQQSLAWSRIFHFSWNQKIFSVFTRTLPVLSLELLEYRLHLILFKILSRVGVT
jgi:hypothetical protein